MIDFFHYSKIWSSYYKSLVRTEKYMPSGRPTVNFRTSFRSEAINILDSTSSDRV